MLSNRNARLNTAFAPKGPATSVPDTVGTGAADTNFDPFIGTGWGQMLDALGASQPGGIKIGPTPKAPSGGVLNTLPMSLQALNPAEDTQDPNSPSALAVQRTRTNANAVPRVQGTE